MLRYHKVDAIPRAETDKKRKKETTERKRWREDGTRIPLYKENITYREPVAVIHVPCTPNSGLVTALRVRESQLEEISGVKFKFKEKETVV